jgi:hypothetical protein
MNSFKSKYPAFAALFALIGSVGQDLGASGESTGQKLSGLLALLPQGLAFEAYASQVGTEYAAIKASSDEAAEIEGGVELLVTDFAFSAPQAQAKINECFALAEWLVSGIPVIEAVFTKA